MKGAAAILIATGLALTGLGGSAVAQDRAQQEQAGTAEISLRKSVGVREFQGRQISGEERQIGRGDSLWRILVEVKGVF